MPDRRFWFEEIQLGLGVWQGQYQGVEGQWLRWYDVTDNWLSTPQEQAEQQFQRAEQAEQQFEQERSRADRLAEQLRALGIDPDG